MSETLSNQTTNPGEEPKKYSFPNSDVPLGSKDQITVTDTKGARVGIGRGIIREPVKFSTVVKDSPDDKKVMETSRIETYKSDVANVLKREGLSSIQVAVAEQKKQYERGTTAQMYKEKKSGTTLITISICIFIMTLILVGYVFWQGMQNKGGKAATGTKTGNQNVLGVGKGNVDVGGQASHIKIEQNQSIQIDGKDAIGVKSDINRLKNQAIEPGAIKEIILSTRKISEKDPKKSTLEKIDIKQWFSVLGTHASEQLIRAMGSNYVFGLYQSVSGEPVDTFIIIDIASYDNAFEGLSNWESYMKQDIFDIFERKFIPEPTVITPNATSSASSSKSGLGSNIPVIDLTGGGVFIDKVNFNKDTRAFYDSKDRVRVLYTFTDPETLIVASSEAALEEILARLTTGKIVR